MSKHSSPFPSLSALSPRARRRLLGGALALLVFEVLYNALLVTGLLGMILTHAIPHMTITWRRAWSVVPGHVYVRDLVIQRDEPSGATWRLELERVDVTISILALLGKELRTSDLEVWGLTVRIHPVTDGSGAQKAGGKPPPKPLRLALHGVQVHQVRMLQVDTLRLTGITEVTGALDMTPGQRIFVEDAHVTLGPGALMLDKIPVAHVEGGSVGATLEVQRQEAEGLDIITGLTEGRVQLVADLPSLDGIKRLSPRFADLPLRGGSGQLRVDVHVKEGRLAQGTRIEGSGAPLVVPVLKPLEFKAPWRLYADVYTREDGAERFGLKLTLGPVQLQGGDGPTLETTEVVVLLGASPPRLGEALPDVHLSLQAARSKPLELRVFNGWLSPNFQVESGHLTLEASSRANPKGEVGEAHLDVTTENVLAHWGGATVGGNLLLDVDARKLAFGKDTMALHGSQLRLRNVTVRTGQEEARGWDGTLSLPEATVTLSPPSFVGRFTGSFSNATPFLALLAQQGAVPHVLSSLLTAKNLELSGQVTLGLEGAKVERVLARAEGLELRAKAESTGSAPHAVLLVKVGPVPLGVEKGAEGLHLQLLSPSSWYEQKTGEKVE